MKKYILGGLGIAVVLGVIFYAANEPSAPTAENMTGVHIMADGSVMSNAGPLPDASVQSDGRVKLGDGSVVMPVADYRGQ